MKSASLAVSTAFLLAIAAVPASAGTITLDFDTAATGSGIIGAPLVTAFGTVTATNAELTTNSDPDFTAAGASGNNIDHVGSPSVASLSFDFDVRSLTLIYGGNIGDFTIRVRDVLNNIVDSFFQASTADGQPAGPITLNGPGIRSVEWFETSGNFAGLDNIVIQVPEPTSIALLGLALVGLGYSSRRRKA